jgi:hypothetical protein
MKKILFIFLMLLSFFCANAQDRTLPTMRNQLPVRPNYHVHKGFHFEFGIGPAFGTIEDRVTYISGAGGILEFSGVGAGFDLKIGGAIQENLMLTLDILSKAVVAPGVKANGVSVPTLDNISMSEVTYGGGFTYYVMPSDIFISATLGTGAFVISDTQTNESSRSEFGFSYQLKAGKHWWISSKWGISVSAAYGKTSSSGSGYDQYGSYTEDISSDRYVIAASIGVK